jgi:hypothetical protein
MLGLLADPPAPLRAATKEKLPLLKMGRYVGNSRAAGSPLETICGVEGDFDAGTMSPEQAARALSLAGVRCVVATTPSHTPTAPRWRVFAPTSAPLVPGARHGLVKRINGVLGGALAVESFTLQRAFYVGRLDDAADYQCLPVEGEFVDLLPRLDPGMGPTERDGAPSVESDADRLFRLAACASEWRAGKADDARAALMACDADCDYTTWSHLGASVYTASGGTGFDLFDEWSSRGSKYPGSETVAAKFADFGRMTQIGPGKLYWIATHLYGWKLAESRKAQRAAEDAEAKATQRMRGTGTTTEMPKANLVTLEDAIKHWVYIENGEQVIATDRDDAKLPFPAHRRAYSASTTFVDGGGKTPKPRLVQIVDLWEKHPHRKTCHSTTHAPGHPRNCIDPDGVDCFNLWRPTPRVETPLALAKPFLDHVAYLVGDPIAERRFLQWLAHVEQRPGEAVQSHYMMVTEAQGVGRNWLANVLDKVWLRQVALSVDLTSMISKGFNGVVGGKLMAVVDEIDEGGNEGDKGRFTSALKEMLTARTRLVNPKYGRQYVEWNVTRWLLFSNSRSPIPMSATDRRINVIENPSEPRGPEYYAALYAMLDDARFIDSVAWFLHSLDIRDFNPGERAIWTEAKAEVIRSGESALSNSVQTLIDEWPGDIVTAEHLRVHIINQTGIAREKLHTLNRHLTGTSAKLYKKRVYVGADKLNVVILRNHELWRDAEPSLLVAEMERGRRLNDETTQSKNARMFD